jgi:hypothetical protein
MGGEGRRARRADNLTAISEPIVYKMWESRTLTPMGLHGLLLGQLYFYLNKFSQLNLEPTIFSCLPPYT